MPISKPVILDSGAVGFQLVDWLCGMSAGLYWCSDINVYNFLCNVQEYVVDMCKSLDIEGWQPGELRQYEPFTKQQEIDLNMFGMGVIITQELLDAERIVRIPDDI